MLRTVLAGTLAAACCWGLAVPASAAQVESSYCFSAEDFPQPLTGICLTQLPKSQGCIRLGSRVLQAGDILTAQQMTEMVFSPLDPESDQQVQVGYLPIYENRVEPETTMTISLRGRADQPPVAEDSALETYKNLPNTGRLKVSDPEGQALTYTLTRQPKRGSVELSQDGSFTYTPKKNKIGIDSFTYTAADPAGQVSREATVTITILKPSDAAQYTDTLGSDCRFAAEWMRHSGIFVGESLAQQPCFSPSREVSRGEFVTMLVKALDVPVDPGLTYTGCTDEIPTWLQPYLAAAIRAGLTAGLPNQEVFAPDTPITGAEAGILLQNALDFPCTGELPPDAAAAAMSVLNQRGFRLEPEAVLTRSDAAQALYQAVCSRREFPV